MTFPPFTNFPTGVGNGVGANVYNTNTGTAATQLVVTDIAGPSSSAPAEFVCLNMTGLLAAGRALTLPTSAAMLAQFSGVPTSYVLRIINSSGGAFSWTLTTNTGWTLNGTMTIAQNTTRDFIVTVNADGTGTIQSIGTGTIS